MREVSLRDLCAQEAILLIFSSARGTLLFGIYLARTLILDILHIMFIFVGIELS